MTRTSLRSCRDLIVWQRAVEVCIAVYRYTRSFPKEEIYGLTNQLRRASVSVPSNIAEGYGRLSRDQYRQFLGIANGSNLELQTQLLIARELGYGDARETNRIEGLSFEVGRMLTAILRKF
jgi:four helix bundle protein